MKVQDVIDAVLDSSCGGKRLAKTCDNLVVGDPEAEVRGIATTFMATIDVVNKARACGANLIITHEPTFYTAGDRLDWLRDDRVYAAKAALLRDSGMSVWRYHDYMHAANPDRIYEGLMDELGWEAEPALPGGLSQVYRVEGMCLRSLARFLRDRLAMPVVRIVGDPDAPCRRVGILVGGASLGLGRDEMPMEFMRGRNLDALVCGEILEWTLCSYARDASALGMGRSLVVVGHEWSEEWGMKRMARWLPALVGDAPVAFIGSGEPFSYV